MSETTVQVEPIDSRPGDEALARLERYDWLVATSARGVSALMRRLGAGGGAGLPKELRVAAVGSATAAALGEAGARVDLIAEEASSSGLVAALVPSLPPQARVVVVRPEGASGPLASALRASGAVVDEAPLYRTIASPGAPALAAAAIDGAFAAVVFTAPSSLDLWLAAAGVRREALIAALTRVVRVAIGPTTSRRMTVLDLPADAIAETPSEAAVAAAVASALGIDLLR
jgi:uroporphyrinogen-III synthase